MSTQLIQPKTLKDTLATDACRARFKEILGERGPQLSAALIQLVNQSFQLQKCDPQSIIGCALMAAALDLSIDPNLGEASIVPYSDKATFQIGYIGYNQLALRSGQYKNLGWKVIHKGELEVWDELSGELVVNSDHPDEEVIGYAAKFKLINGFERGSYWRKEDCFKHAERFSKAYRAGLNDEKKRAYSVWFTDPDRACLKTVIKSLVKLWGPKSIQMQKALKVDDGAVVNAETGEVEFVDAPALETSKPVFEEPAPDAPAPAKPVEQKSADAPQVNHLKLLRGYVKLAGLQDAEICNYLKLEGIANVTKLEALDSELLEVLANGAQDLIAKVNSAKAKG